MKIYTRTGDDGSTSLSGGRRISKFHDRVEAFGTIDELIAWIGVLRDHPENESRKEVLIYIQDQLMVSAAVLATDKEDYKKTGKLIPDTGCISKLENEIDSMEENLKPLKNLIIPGGNILVSYCHIARCVCRRAERAVLRLNEAEKTPEVINKFLNRLADYLFVLARIICLELNIEEIKWHI